MPSEIRDDKPALGKVSFICPHCRALAHQTWFELLTKKLAKGQNPNLTSVNMTYQMRLSRSRSPEEQMDIMGEFRRLLTGQMFVTNLTGAVDGSQVGVLTNGWVSACVSCDNITIWKSDKIIDPCDTETIKPHEGMSDDIKADFNEAASIVDASPRGACALLRLCIQKLCKELGYDGKNINDDIGELVRRGLNSEVQKALDVVRVTGNNALHPLEMDISDDTARARIMFKLVNFIVKELIADPKERAQLYAELPDGARDAIVKRDKPKPIK